MIFINLNCIDGEFNGFMWCFVISKSSHNYRPVKTHFILQQTKLWVGWLYWGLTPLLQLKSCGGRWHTCVTFLSEATDYFSHMLQQRWEAKIRRNFFFPQPGFELITTKLWVRHAHHSHPDGALNYGIKRFMDRLEKQKYRGPRRLT